MKKALTRLTLFASNRRAIYIQSALAKDSAFPFTDGQTVLVRIKGKSLIVEAAP